MLDKYTDMLCTYASYQIESGAQVLQIFESWAHHMSEDLFVAFAKPAANRLATYLKDKHPDVPVVYFANGGSVYLNAQTDMNVDSLAIDWKISMPHAREIVGNDFVLTGNVDPIILYGSEDKIRNAAKQCIQQAIIEGRIAQANNSKR